jgi:hypothetical protein
VSGILIDSSDLSSHIDTISQLSGMLSTADNTFKTAFVSIAKKLPSQGKKAIIELEELLENWSLMEITSIVRQVKARLSTIDLFKKRIEDDKTYEIKGDNSIHRILEKAMWLINESYWIIKSNSTLREFIGRELGKKDKNIQRKDLISHVQVLLTN